ncbi:hypothetical protein ACFL09_01555 [Planctomycetota bacterium]
MRRFAPLLTLPTCEIQPVFGNVVKQARVRTALESWSPMSLSVDPPRMDIRADPATPRRVLSQLVTQWSKTRPIAVTQTAGFLCLAEKALVDQGNWPLNARNVPGFRVDGVSFESLCERLGEAIQAAHDAERGEAPRWVVTVGDHGAWGAFNPSGPYLNEPITTEIKGGTARTVICQVAMLQPNCFWAAEATVRRGHWGFGREPEPRRDEPEEASYHCDIVFGFWSAHHKETTEQLVTMLTSPPVSPAGQARFRRQALETEVLIELAARGPQAAQALTDAYRSTAASQARQKLRGWLMALCSWGDNREVVARFAAAEIDKTDDRVDLLGLEMLARVARGEPAMGDEFFEPRPRKPLHPAAAPGAEAGGPGSDAGAFTERVGWLFGALAGAAVVAAGLLLAAAIRRRKRRTRRDVTP